MTQRILTFDQWQDVMDALSPEQAALELDIERACESADGELKPFGDDPVTVEFTEEDAIAVDAIVLRLE